MSDTKSHEEEKTLSFDRIAVCLPGGGFRAAAFSLGILDFLHEVGLLSNVKSISSVSGGTITATRYAYSVAKQESYEDFHENLKKWLKSNELLSSSLKRLNSWKSFGHKNRNLINAFSKEYNDFMDMDFQEMEEGLKTSSSLEQVIFNSTDFSKGLQFRFITGSGRFGNGKKNFEELKPYVKLGDVVAASSCFPLGFEPISFPSDFVEPEVLEKLQQETKDSDYSSIGLMDGGILDNLGILSYLTGRNDTDTITAFIVGSAGKPTIKPFTFTGKSKWANYISLLFSWLFYIPVVILFALIMKFYGGWFVRVLISTVFIVLTVIQVLFQGILIYGRNKLELEQRLSLPRRKLGIYILDRLNSAVTMNTSIFLEGAKSSNLKLMYSKRQNQVCEAQIYLFEGTIHVKEKLVELGVFVSCAMTQLSDECSNMDTTLWFTRKHVDLNILNKLILHGKLSCCYSMMQSIVKSKGATYSSLEQDPMFKKLRAEWHKLERSDILSKGMA